MVYQRLIAGLCLVLAACGGQIHFVKEGGTQAQLDRDIHDCQQGAPGIRFDNSNIPTRAEWIACVERKGWTIESMQGVPGFHDRQAAPVPQERT